MLDKAIRLSPRDPFLAMCFNGLSVAAFVRERFDETLDWLAKAIEENPLYPGNYRLLVATYGHLGRIDEARAALEHLLRLMPNLTVESSRNQVPWQRPADMERYLNGLRKAGLREA